MFRIFASESFINADTTGLSNVSLKNSLIRIGKNVDLTSIFFKLIWCIYWKLMYFSLKCILMSLIRFLYILTHLFPPAPFFHPFWAKWISLEKSAVIFLISECEYLVSLKPAIFWSLLSLTRLSIYIWFSLSSYWFSSFSYSFSW